MELNSSLKKDKPFSLCRKERSARGQSGNLYLLQLDSNWSNLFPQEAHTSSPWQSLSHSQYKLLLMCWQTLLDSGDQLAKTAWKYCQGKLSAIDVMRTMWGTMWYNLKWLHKICWIKKPFCGYGGQGLPIPYSELQNLFIDVVERHFDVVEKALCNLKFCKIYCGESVS